MQQFVVERSRFVKLCRRPECGKKIIQAGRHFYCGSACAYAAKKACWTRRNKDKRAWAAQHYLANKNNPEFRAKRKAADRRYRRQKRVADRMKVLRTAREEARSRGVPTQLILREWGTDYIRPPHVGAR